jgi:hypothetical protein
MNSIVTKIGHGIEKGWFASTNLQQIGFMQTRLFEVKREPG